VRIRLLGVGMGPQHVTVEVASALREADYVVAASKADDDELLAVRQAICEEYGVELVAVPDPARDRDPADYPAAVAAWHDARAAAYAEVIRERGGTAAFLVWGDPSLYDSTIRVVERVASSVGAEWDVLPGVSTPSLLAARHRIVLHEVGRPVHVTTARRLPEALAGGQTNIVVMLGNEADLRTLERLADWTIWWGANLGTPTEELVSGLVSEVLPDVLAARGRARQAAGWVMDAYLLRSSGG
jgi:precorrin-6A synthase